jgi:pyruvate dehydrogenase E2 component (dihydrolipoamide acetyltransferase)
MTAMALTPAPEPVTQGTQMPATRASPRAGPQQISWKARRMAREAGLDLRGVNGSGPGGRIVAKDVASALATPPVEKPAPVSVSPVAAQLASTLGLDLQHVAGSGPEGQIRQADVIAAAAAVIQGRAGPGPIATPGPGGQALVRSQHLVRRRWQRPSRSPASVVPSPSVWRSVVPRRPA